jgi:hypothetical protein
MRLIGCSSKKKGEKNASILPTQVAKKIRHAVAGQWLARIEKTPGAINCLESKVSAPFGTKQK